MAGGHHPRGAVEYGAEVIPAAQFGFAGGDAHPYRQFQRQLRCDRGIDSRRGRVEYGTHAVTRVIEHPPVIRTDNLTKNLVVSLHRHPHGAGICLPPTGGTLDIGEQKREHAHDDSF